MKDFFKSKKGITLVALVITIVVLIILAGVIINITLGNGGIIDRAKTAKQEYLNAQDYEDTQIAKYTNEIDKYVGGHRDVQLTDEVKNYIDSQLNKSAITVSQSGDNSLTTTSTKYSFTTVGTQKGTNLTLDNGGVKIGAGINYVLVSITINVSGNDQAGPDIRIYKNDTQFYSFGYRLSSASNQSFVTMPVLINVAEGDHIYFYSSRGSAAATLINYTMTVVEI